MPNIVLFCEVIDLWVCVLLRWPAFGVKGSHQHWNEANYENARKEKFRQYIAAILA